MQQWNVLRTNIDVKVGMFHGHAGGQISKGDWENVLKEDMVRVYLSISEATLILARLSS